jgi:hypothetical protein
MHDPMTVAFTIKYPWRKYPGSTRKWESQYRAPFITIWHVDPEDDRGMCVRRRDDTCGWFTPPYTTADRASMKELSDQQYREIFSKQVAEREKKSYAYVCYVPDCYDAIFWSWRAIKWWHVNRKRQRVGWMYGEGRRFLTDEERDYVYSLSANPVDNLQMTFKSVKDESTFWDLFHCVYTAYIRHHRPWYRHPRWHVWHWRIQVHPWQDFRRWWKGDKTNEASSVVRSQD